MKQTPINEVARQLQAANPSHLVGYSEDKGLIAVQSGEEWIPVISATITGQYARLDGALPLLNGKRVYENSDFVKVL